MSLCWMWMSLNQVNKTQSSYNNQFLISCWVPQINLCSKEKGWALIWVTIIRDFVKYERSRDGGILLLWRQKSFIWSWSCVYQILTMLAIRHQWWMQISIKIIKVFCQAKLGGGLRIPGSVLSQIREPITWISSRKCIMHHTLHRSFSIRMFSLSHHAFKRPHLMDQCKIHELFQCVISDMPARSVCPSKQFIESKLADFALMAIFSGQPLVGDTDAVIYHLLQV